MANILAQRWLLGRRHFLRGAGAAVALPLLDAMTPLRADRAAPERPGRSVFVYIPNGVNGMAWQVKKAGRGYDLSASLRPLGQHRDDYTVFSGLHHPNGLGQAHVCADTWLTGAKIDAQGARKYENTISCDQLMAEVTAPHTRFPSLELSINSGTGQPGNSTTLAFSRDGVPSLLRTIRGTFSTGCSGPKRAELPPSGPGWLGGGASSTRFTTTPSRSIATWARKTAANSMSIYILSATWSSGRPGSMPG